MKISESYKWIKKCLELTLLWGALCFFVYLLLWMAYDFFLCNPSLNECEFKSWLNFLISVVGVLGAGFISAIVLLFYQLPGEIDARTKKFIDDSNLNRNLSIIKNYLRKIKEEIKKNHSSDSNISTTKEPNKLKFCGVFIDSPQGDDWAETIIDCLYDLNYMIDYTPSCDLQEAGPDAIKHVLKFNHVVVIICTDDTTAIYKERLKHYINEIKNDKKQSFSHFLGILFGYDYYIDLDGFIEEQHKRENSPHLEFRKYDFTSANNICGHPIVKDIGELIKNLSSS